MTNKLAIYLGGLLVVALILDFVVFDGYYAIFWTKKLVELIEYIAIWR